MPRPRQCMAHACSTAAPMYGPMPVLGPNCPNFCREWDPRAFCDPRPRQCAPCRGSHTLIRGLAREGPMPRFSAGTRHAARQPRRHTPPSLRKRLRLFSVEGAAPLGRPCRRGPGASGPAAAPRDQPLNPPLLRTRMVKQPSMRVSCATRRSQCTPQLKGGKRGQLRRVATHALPGPTLGELHPTVPPGHNNHFYTLHAAAAERRRLQSHAHSSNSFHCSCYNG